MRACVRGSSSLFPFSYAPRRFRQEEYTELREVYMRGGEGFVIVYSIIDNKSFMEVKYAHTPRISLPSSPSDVCSLPANSDSEYCA